MARIRTLKPEFWTSEQVVECSPIARLLFVGTWTFADDGGNMVASSKTLKMQIFPGDDFTVGDVEKMVCELITAGLLVEYVVDAKRYWHITGWSHQKIDRPTYKHPPFDDAKIVDYSSSHRRAFDEPSPPEGKGREGNGREVLSVSETAVSDPEPLTGEIIPFDATLPSAPRQAKAERDLDLLDAITDQWNAWANRFGSPLVRRLTGTRATHCRRRVADLLQFTEAESPQAAFSFLLDRCSESFFARGSPTKPLEFDQLMSEKFMTRMLEGSFQHREQRRSY